VAEKIDLTLPHQTQLSHFGGELYIQSLN